MTDEKLLLWLWLQGVLGPADAKFLKLLEDFTYLEEVYNNRMSTAMCRLLSPAQYKRATTLTTDDFRPMMDKLKDIGAAVLTYQDSRYPQRLRETRVPPMLLFVTGDVSALSCQHMIAGVGTRNITHYGRECVKKICTPISQNGVCLVSGLAHGVDSEVHKNALENGAPTVAVLGNAIDRTYPAANVALRRQIEQSGGAVVSEYAPGSSENRYNFPQRNRIISGLSRAVVIFEASQKSGTMITANWALDDGREVFAVPGSIFSPQSEGTNRLIEMGASMAITGEDIMSQLSIAYTPSEDEAKKEPVSYSAKAKKVLKCLEECDCDIDTLVVKASMPVEDVFSAITELEITGDVLMLKNSSYTLNNH